jgi:fluoride exporter
MLLLAVAVGGGAGALGRYLCTRWIHARTGTAFPWGTLAVNVLGSFLLGLLLPLLATSEVAAPLRAFTTVGLLGSFTTFSTFASETVRLLEQKQKVRALIYVAASLLLGLLSVATGYRLSPGGAHHA